MNQSNAINLPLNQEFSRLQPFLLSLELIGKFKTEKNRLNHTRVADNISFFFLSLVTFLE